MLQIDTFRPPRSLRYLLFVEPNANAPFCLARKTLAGSSTSAVGPGQFQAGQYLFPFLGKAPDLPNAVRLLSGAAASWFPAGVAIVSPDLTPAARTPVNIHAAAA